MKKQVMFVLAVIFAVSALSNAQNLVVNPGFETPETTGGGWPSTYGDWNGDYSSIVGASAGIIPLEGSKMLKFLGSSHGGSGGSANSCQVFQIINVSSYAQEISVGKVSVAASAYFNRIAGDSQTDTKFYVSIFAYAGEPSSFPWQWETSPDGGKLARADGFVYSDGDPATWEQGQTQLALPTNTDFVIIGVNANEDIYNDYSLPEFDGHFADDVYAEVIIPALVGLEVTGPDEVAEDSQTQYSAIALYDNNSTSDVTDLAVWSVEPNVIADIEAGLLTTEKIFQPEAVTITAQYTEDGNTFDANKPVSLFAICPSGNALQFDGVDDYVALSENAVTTTQFTVAAWANHYGHAGGYWKQNTIFSQRDYSIGDNHSAVVLMTERIEDGPASATIRSSSGAIQRLVYTRQPYGEWHHYAMTVDSEDFIFYIDGVEVNRTSNQQNGDYVTGIDCVDIGRHKYITYFVLRDTGLFNGAIDDVRIYDRALSAEEVQMSMHTQPESNEPNLVGYWNFDEGEGQVAHDTSGNGNNGQLGSAPDIDDSDPNWVDSNAPVGICTLEGLLERNVNEALEIKLNILDEILEALAREDASVNILGGMFGELDYGYLDKRDIRKAGREIHSAIQSEEQAIHLVEKSVDDLEDSLDVLASEDGPPDSNSTNDNRNTNRLLTPPKR
ncbi:MAG: LamG domain-containing protein [Planctomycetota bacterium]|nr:MAG: LamG domain-containing protein [Planctomycetota bacterium]